MPNWYESLKKALSEARLDKEMKPTREISIVITMLEQTLAYAWLWIVRK